jgi:hypothetical protein
MRNVNSRGGFVVGEPLHRYAVPLSKAALQGGSAGLDPTFYINRYKS